MSNIRCNPPAQDFMRHGTEDELREKWFVERRDARAAFKRRHKDTVRRQKKRNDKRGGGAFGV